MFGPELFDVVRDAAIGELSVQAVGIEPAAELLRLPLSLPQSVTWSGRARHFGFRITRMIRSWAFVR